MKGFSQVGRIAEFRNREPKSVFHNGIEIVVLKVDESVFAFENNCPHQHFSLLHQGIVDGCSITCPMHGWTFNLKSGNSTIGNGKLRKFEVQIHGDGIWVGTESDGTKFSLFDTR